MSYKKSAHLLRAEAKINTKHDALSRWQYSEAIPSVEPVTEPVS